MKFFFKTRIFSTVVAMILMLCLAVPTETMAASKITLKDTSKTPTTFYTGHSYNLEVSGTAVQFYSCNKEVATITTSGKLTAKAPGTVTIVAKNKKSGKKVVSTRFTIKQRATAVNSKFQDLTLLPGETVDLIATLTPDTSTDVIRYISDDPSIATVDLISGKLTAVGTGFTTIKILAKATKATPINNKYNIISTVDVTVTAITEGKNLTYVITPQQVEVNVPTPIYVSVLDNDGTVLYKGLCNADPSYYAISCNLTCTGGALTEDGLVFNSMDSSAVLEITEHTFTYDDDYREITKKIEFLITPIAGKTTTVSEVDYYIGNIGETPNYNRIASSADTTITAGTSYKNLYLNLEHYLDQSPVYYNRYTLTSTNDNIITVPQISIDKYSGIAITAHEAGTCTLLLREDGTVIKAFTIVVLP